MNAVGAIVIYLIIWWCAFFAVLPWGVKGRWEGEDDGVAGAEPGAPVKPDLKRKLLWATLIAFVFWAITVAIIMSGVIDYRD